ESLTKCARRPLDIENDDSRRPLWQEWHHASDHFVARGANGAHRQCLGDGPSRCRCLPASPLHLAGDRFAARRTLAEPESMKRFMDDETCRKARIAHRNLAKLGADADCVASGGRLEHSWRCSAAGVQAALDENEAFQQLFWRHPGPGQRVPWRAALCKFEI